MIEHLNNVPPKLRLDRSADLSGRRVKRGLLECIDHLATGEPAQVASVWRRAGIDRLVTGRLGEVCSALRHICVDRVGEIFSVDKDVRSMYLLGALPDVSGDLRIDLLPRESGPDDQSDVVAPRKVRAAENRLSIVAIIGDGSLPRL